MLIVPQQLRGRSLAKERENMSSTASDSQNPKQSDEKAADAATSSFIVKNKLWELRYKLRALTIGMMHLENLSADGDEIYFHADVKPLGFMLEEITEFVAQLHADACTGGDRSALEF